MIETKGPVHRPGDADYDARRTGYNLALDHRPALVVAAADRADVAAAVRYAAAHGLAVAVRATGHGVSVPTDGQLVIDTSGLDGVTVDPAARTATVRAGVRRRDVLAAAAPHGLAPLSGSNPDVGAVGGRDAGYLAFSTAMIGPVGLDALRAAHSALHERLRPWATGGTFANFLGLDDAGPATVRTAYPEPLHRRLTGLKAVYDPGNLFRLNFNIPPAS
ncbi:FAD-binding protein [Kitasatospora sp. NPDC008115]|uniref:FAD-binding protein n=1 Tax=Kitasatospora sp. NPDC008115 TaxID=3364022 RepID=UPI0036F15BA3